MEGLWQFYLFAQHVQVQLGKYWWFICIVKSFDYIGRKFFLQLASDPVVCEVSVSQGDP